MGQFNIGQALVARTMRPVLGIVHHTLTEEHSLRGRGPVLLAVKIDDKPGAGPTIRDPALTRNRFMKGLGTGRGGPLDA